MDSYEQQNKRTESNRETRGALADSAPIIASGILAGGQIIAAKISGGMDESSGEGDGK